MVLENHLRRMPRKGQFFVLSAVVIALVLFSLGKSLQQDKALRPGMPQEMNLVALRSSLYHEINTTVMASGAQNITENLETFLRNKEREFAAKGVTFVFDYEITWPTVLVTTDVEGENYAIRMTYP